MTNDEKTVFASSRRDFFKLAAAVSASFALDKSRLSLMLPGTEGKDKWPVVVIGAGLGGLCAAAHLARAGFPVTLVERHDRPGGYATSFERANGKYEFDVSLHATASAREALRAVFEGAGIADNVETIELPDLCRIITPDYDLTWPQRNPDAIADQLCGLFPKESGGIKQLFAEILGILDEAMLPFDRDSVQERMAFPTTHPKMWNIRNKTLGDLMDDYIRDPRLRSIFSSFWGYYGLPPSQLSGFYYAVATASYMRYGGHYIINRSQDLSNALMHVIEQAGGKVMLETEATGISLKDGSIDAVALSNGSLIPARSVISNASVPTTMAMLPDEGLPPGVVAYQDRMKSYRPSLSTFIIWLGLNHELREEIKGYEIFVSKGDDVEKSYEACLACDSDNVDLAVTVYDNAYKGYSKPGTSTLSIMTLSGYEPWRRFETDYFTGRKGEYNREKERIADIMIEQAERLVIPGLRSMIEVKEIATPLTNVFFTANPEGAIYGYEQSMANSYMNRLPIMTPIDGLYCASAWTSPGGGYQPCLESGRNAAFMVMREFENKA
ncbi:MAG TPA: FAD-dependent oxidoreductase [Acidobacteriota bacterium]|nr:FAD-dependent oxidoreductase [Acidobacteriota bacterium]